MDKRKIRDGFRLIGSLVFAWLYVPHLIIYAIGGKRGLVNSDLQKMQRQVKIKLPNILLLIYLLHTNPYYRRVFYYRIGAAWELIIGWWRPADRYFQLSRTMTLGPGFELIHPYSTILNAKSIGKNFVCLHLTTIGATSKGLPVIGDNVTLGASVTIIGPVRIGNNVTIGAGSVVVKDIPDDAVAVGNPAKIIKTT